MGRFFFIILQDGFLHNLGMLIKEVHILIDNLDFIFYRIC